MARSSQNENTIRNNQQNDLNQQNTSYQRGQADINQFNANETKLNSGQDVAADPWKNAGYLGNVNRLQAGALDSATNAGVTDLSRLNRRTGGMNNDATAGASKGLVLQKMQLGDQLSSQRAAQDYSKNVAYQENQAVAPLQGANAESGYYGTAARANTGALDNMSQYALNQQMYNYSLYNKMMQAAAAGVSGGLGGGGASGAASGVSSGLSNG